LDLLGRLGHGKRNWILDFLQAGDTLMVTRIDRLARSVADLERIVASVKAAGAFLRTTEQPIDTSTPAGTAFLQMLGVFAQFETALRRERQMEGISRAKAEGRYKGRPATVDVIKVRELHSNGVTPSGIAKRLAIGRASVYRALAKTKAA
jgi:DNA invertase Pin-like site-specific DNA recombinase